MEDAEASELEVADISSGAPIALETPTSRKFQFLLQFARELVRGSLAFGLLILFGLTLSFSMKRVGTPAWKDAKEMLEVLLPPESALLGSAIAFFFGGKTRD